jgi:RND family efflux transporter MFP subunit
MSTEQNLSNVATAHRAADHRAGASRRLAWALVPLAVLCGCAGEPTPSAPAPASPPHQVSVATAVRSMQAVLTEVVGTVRSSREATIAPLVSGTVAEVRVHLGSVVRAGEILVRLSADEFEARLDQTRAGSVLAGQERSRAVALKAAGAITAAQYDAAVSRWGAARAQEAEASALAERKVVRAPFAGIVTAKMITVGEAALPGRPLLVLESREPSRFEAQVPDAVSEALAVGRSLPVRIDGLERELEGRIAELHPSSDDTTRSRLVKLDLPRTPGLRSGQFGRLLLGSGQAPAVTVPAGAVVRRGQLETVFIVDAGVARLRLVRCGRERDGRVQIASGLSGGEMLALRGANELADGQRVEAVQ